MSSEIKPPTTEEIEQALKNGGVVNLEIGQALKEFEVQDKQYGLPPKTVEQNEMPRMVTFVIKFSGGFIKSQKQAEYLLIVISGLMLLTSGYLMFGGNFTKRSDDLGPMRNLHPELMKP